MSWSEIKKAVNSNIDVPLNELIGTNSLKVKRLGAITYGRYLPNDELIFEISSKCIIHSIYCVITHASDTGNNFYFRLYDETEPISTVAINATGISASTERMYTLSNANYLTYSSYGLTDILSMCIPPTMNNRQGVVDVSAAKPCRELDSTLGVTVASTTGILSQISKNGILCNNGFRLWVGAPSSVVVQSITFGAVYELLE